MPGSGAPQLVSLNLTAPSLGAAPGLQPLALAPSPVLAPAPFAPAPLPASPIVQARAAQARPARSPRFAFGEAPLEGSAPAGARLALDDAHQERTSVGDLIELTKRMFGESSKPGYESAEYLRHGAPFTFGSEEAATYRSALSVPRAKSGAAELQALVGSAAGLAKSAGIAVEPGERGGNPVLKIVPLKEGHRLNRLAWDMKNVYASALEYAPAKTNGAVAAYNSTAKVLYLPDFGREDSFEAILHESRHAAFTKRLGRGDISVFHASLVAYPRRSIAPGASSYTDYMSMEELSTHAKTLLHEVIRARRDGKAVSGARADAWQFMDVLRTAEINLFQLQRLLASGSLKSYRLTGESWPVVPGGHWEAINLPHAILALPVLDGPPAPKRGLLSRLFKDEPETAALKQARRHAAALRPLVRDLAVELEAYLAALRAEEPDLVKARAAAARMVSLSEKADKAFAAAP